jgi:1-phosphatidylinositol-3-phosphate 5-kinase
VLLRGTCWEELKKVKRVVQLAVFAAYHLLLESSFLADEGSSIPQFLSSSNNNDIKMDDPAFSYGEQDKQLHRLKEGNVTNNDSRISNSHSMLVSLSSRCIPKGIVCKHAQLLRIKFYGSSDKPLGRYLSEDLFDEVKETTT